MCSKDRGYHQCDFALNARASARKTRHESKPGSFPRWWILRFGKLLRPASVPKPQRLCAS